MNTYKWGFRQDDPRVQLFGGIQVVLPLLRREIIVSALQGHGVDVRVSQVGTDALLLVSTSEGVSTRQPWCGWIDESYSIRLGNSTNPEYMLMLAK